MPILMARDTQRALGPGVRACESRSLLQQKLVFFEDIDDYKRVALDLVLTDGHRDLHLLRKQKQEAKEKAEGSGRTDTKRYRDAVAFLETTAPLFDGQRRPAHLGLPSDWTKNIPAARFRSFDLVTAERLVIGLSNGVLENSGLTLHRFFGVPFIPGSALKGVARDAAMYVEDTRGLARGLFGNNETEDKEARQGDVSFLAAFPVNPNARLEYEVCTPHYKAYYGMELDQQTRHPVNPNALDDENPIPNLFPVVAKGERFRFQLLALSSRLTDQQASRPLDAAVKCLKEA
ncbi:MAG: type III-B CRISPR module RAMP protein Cmr6, partial [Betaproteobacteria bacterium]|nr:type III-B CRISPR module RAMP protein Cmr6 [Betaproteobacteria bacterium]